MGWLFGLMAMFIQTGADPAPVIYERDFHGSYAKSGECAKAAERWVLSERQIIQADVWCDVRDLEQRNGALQVMTANCTRAETSLPDRTYILDLMSADVIKVRVDETTTLLERCDVN